MRLAVLADIHDNLQGLRQLLRPLQASQPDQVLCCGDLTRAATLRQVAALGLPLHFCVGNCDEAHEAELMEAADAAGWRGSGRQGSLDLDGLRIGFTHFPALAQSLARSGAYDAVFYGHSHRAGASRLDIGGRACLLANPGEVQGRFGQISALVFDSRSLDVDWVRI